MTAADQTHDALGPDLGYADALAELEGILAELEDGDVDIDRLATQVRRASDLVRHCQGRLADARVEVARIVVDLDDEPSTAPPPLTDPAS